MVSEEFLIVKDTKILHSVLLIHSSNRLATNLNIKDGIGVMFWPDGTKYEGDFKEDQPHGYGRKIFANGEYYEG
jgi:hypothetical protein